MKWIKYQIVQSIVDGQPILAYKKLGYNESNFAIAQTEAYNGEYTIEEDGEPGYEDPMDKLIDLFYPVGRIIMSADPTNPGVKWTKTKWVAWGSGRVPVGVNASDGNFNTVEKTGGSKELQKHSHEYTPSGTIGDTTSTMQDDGSHSHYLTYTKDGASGTDVPRVYANGKGELMGTSAGTAIDGLHKHTMDAHSHTFTGSKGTTVESGTGTSGNLQPYITCYMWKRIA